MPIPHPKNNPPAGATSFPPRKMPALTHGHSNWTFALRATNRQMNGIFTPGVFSKSTLTAPHEKNLTLVSKKTYSEAPASKPSENGGETAAENAPLFHRHPQLCKTAHPSASTLRLPDDSPQ